MPKLLLTDSDYDIIAHCLSVAAIVFDHDSETMQDTPGHTRLAEQFTFQATQARKLQDRIDNRE